MARFYASAPSTSAASFSLSTAGYFAGLPAPRAAYYNGKTYLAWCDDSKRIWAAQYTASTHTLSTPVLLATVGTSVDGAVHLSPAILVRSSDHRIMVFAVANGGTNRPAYWLSTNAEDATAFGSVNLFGDANDYTFSEVVQLSGGDIYYFTDKGGHSLNGVISVFKSTDAGATWSSRVDLLSPRAGTALYCMAFTDGTNLDILATDTDRTSTPSAVYGFRYDGTTLYKTDGTSLGTTFPVAANLGSLVKSSAEGSAWCAGWAYSGGNPHALIACNDTGSTTVLYREVDYSGGSWTSHNVTDSNGILGGNYYQTVGAMTKTDPYTLYLMVEVSGKFEIQKWTSSDSGSSWAKAADVTTGSSLDNAAPDTPLNADASMLVNWGLGTYTSDSSFDFTIYGYGS